MRILPSAFKHDVPESTIVSALQVPMRWVDLDDGLRLVVGADSTGRLYEIVIADPEGDDPRVIHAVLLRPTFLHLFDRRPDDRRR